jgi:hypothetical protein
VIGEYAIGVFGSRQRSVCRKGSKMKKLLVFTLFLSTVLLVTSLLWEEHRVAHGGPAIENGNVNGDAAIDLSDAIYLLTHLFQGGPAPQPCPGAGAGAALGGGGGPALDPELPATGQGRCKDISGDFSLPEPSCDNTDCPGQDSTFQAGCPIEGRFVILPGPNGVIDPAVAPKEDPGDPDVTIPAVDDTVFDRCTGLEWQRSTADTNDDQVYTTVAVGGGVFESEDGLEWSDALAYCEGLDYAGHSDWRLPNAMELQSIVDYGGVVETPAEASTLQNLVDDAFILATYKVNANFQSTHWTSTCRAACSSDSAGRCIIDNPSDPLTYLVPDDLWAVYVGFASSEGGGMGRSKFTFEDLPTEATVYLLRAVRRGTINAAAGGGAATEQGQGGVTVSGNGDVNGDNGLDLSDAIYLLTFLFQGGPAPLPCPDLGPQTETDCGDGLDDDADGDTDCADADCVFQPSCDIARELASTGVTDCYDANGAIDPACDAIPGQDAAYQAGCALTGDARFVHNLGPDGRDDMTGGAGTQMPPQFDDTVTDLCTGLEWQRVKLDFNRNGTIGNNMWATTAGQPGDADDETTPDVIEGDHTTWCEAVAACEDLVLTGDGFALSEHATGALVHDDWRYPNVREIYSLIFYARLTSVAPTHVTHPVQLLQSETLIHPLFGHQINGRAASTIRAGAGAFVVGYYQPNIGSGTGLEFPSPIWAVRNANP